MLCPFNGLSATDGIFPEVFSRTDRLVGLERSGPRFDFCFCGDFELLARSMTASILSMTRLQLARSVAASAPSIAGITGVLLASPGYYRGTFSQICDGIYPGYYKGTATRVYDGIDPRYDQGTVSYVHDWSSLVANMAPARCMTAPTPAVTMIQLAWSITASTPGIIRVHVKKRCLGWAA